MLLDQKPLIYVWRPFYRAVFEKTVWPFLGRVKVFFFAESHVQLARIENRLASVEHAAGAATNAQFAEMRDHLASLERIARVENQAQFGHMADRLTSLERAIADRATSMEQQAATFEQLYLCFLSDPDRTTHSEMEGLLAAERRNQVLRDDVGTRLAAFDERNQALLNRLVSTEAQNRSLLEIMVHLDRNHRELTFRLEELDSEGRQRWEVLERLLMAFLSDPDHRSYASGAETGNGQRRHMQVAAGVGHDRS